MKILRLAVEYKAPPFFKVDPDEMGHTTAEELGLSPHLVAAITEWDQEFQGGYNPIYPPDSRDLTPERKVRHNLRGKELAQQVQEELGQSVTVLFVALT